MSTTWKNRVRLSAWKAGENERGQSDRGDRMKNGRCSPNRVCPSSDQNVRLRVPRASGMTMNAITL
jgi:hypothetical protein